MSRVATAELGLASTAVADNNGDFDVFLSLRSGAVGEDFSSGIGKGRSADTDEAASSLDLVAVASGEAELNTVTSSKPESKETSAPVNPEQCQKYGTIACIGCIFAQDCQDRQAAMTAGNTEVQPGEQLSTLEQLLREDDAPGEIVWAQTSPDDFDGGELPVADSPRVVETSADKPDGSTEKITLQEREGKTSTSEPVEVLGEDTNIEAAEAPLFGLKTAPEIAADDTKDVGESRPESASEISNEEPFIEVTEVSSPPAEMKPHVIDASSAAAHDNNKQPTLEPLDTPAQTETAPVSLAINEGKQTGGENSNPLENKTAYPVAGKDNVTSRVVENTYDGNDDAAVSDIKPSSIEHPKENDVVIATSKSSNPEPRQAAEGNFTPIFEQRLAAQFDAKEMDKLVSESIDGSNVKPLQNTQPREAKLGMAAGYDDSIQTLNGTDNEQPGNLTLDVDDVPLTQERTVAASVLAEHDKNETYQSPGSYSIGQSGRTPQAILSQEQMLVESSENSLIIGDRANFDSNLVQPKIDDVETDVFVANDVVNTTDKTDVAASVEMIDITPNLPDKHTAVDRNGTQLAVDLPQKLGDKLAVDTDASEPQIPVFRQLDCYDTTADIGRSEDKIWAEEEVFFVKQDLPGVEPELTLTEVAAVVSPAEVVMVREEADDLKLSVDDEIGVDMDSAGQLDNFKTSSVPGITNDYEPVEHIAIPTSPAIEPIRDVELDAAVVKRIPEEYFLPREERESIVMEASEKSDLPRMDDEVEAIITDTGDVELSIDLPEAQEELVATEVSEAVESELDEQNDLAVDSAVDSYGYNSETSAVSDNVLVVKSCPSSGLWPDDSRLNPEEEVVAATQSVTDNTSLVSRLVGMFVVAMCVVRGRQAGAILSS